MRRRWFVALALIVLVAGCNRGLSYSELLEFHAAEQRELDRIKAELDQMLADHAARIEELREPLDSVLEPVQGYEERLAKIPVTVRTASVRSQIKVEIDNASKEAEPIRATVEPKITALTQQHADQESRLRAHLREQAALVERLRVAKMAAAKREGL